MGSPGDTSRPALGRFQRLRWQWRRRRAWERVRARRAQIVAHYRGQFRVKQFVLHGGDLADSPRALGITRAAANRWSRMPFSRYVRLADGRQVFNDDRRLRSLLSPYVRTIIDTCRGYDQRFLRRAQNTPSATAQMTVGPESVDELHRS